MVSLDFSGIDGVNSAVALPSTISPSDAQVIEVAGFGNVAFGLEAGPKPTANFVESAPGEIALVFDSSQVVTVNFFPTSAVDVENVVVSFVGVEPIFTTLDGITGTISLPAQEGGPVLVGNITGLEFDVTEKKIPEPSTAILGFIGAMVLLRRRR